ncbi:MAG: hypothetical protein QXX08_01380 [Candidatus Bathyarchaeia archaeon]
MIIVYFDKEWVSVHDSGEKELKALMKGIEKTRGFIRRLLKSKGNLKV